MPTPRPTRPKVVAVTGATGYVGARVVDALVAEGAEVRAIGRDVADLRLPSAELVPRLAQAFFGADVVVHAAAHVHVRHETRAAIASFHRVNALGTRAVVHAAERARVPRVVLVSTIGVYGFASAVPARETDPPAPRTQYGASKWLAELELAGFDGERRIARLATVHGPHDRANFAMLRRAIATGAFVLPGDGSARKSVVHELDAGRCLARLALAREAPGVVNVAAPALSVASIVDTMAKEVGVRPPPRSALLGAAIRSAARAGPEAMSERARRLVSALLEASEVSTERLAAFCDLRAFRHPVTGEPR